MANRIRTITLRDGDSAVLEQRTRSGTAREAQRAKMVLRAAEEWPAEDIALHLDCSVNTVRKWRAAYAEKGLKGLEDAPRPGRPRTVVDEKTERAVLHQTLVRPPEELGVTHWSSRLLASKVGLGFSQVAAVWRKWKIKPWLLETFKFSTDPELEGKVRDVIGLYLNPPEGAVVLCVDEKSQIQALDRTQPMLPVRPGLSARRTHDYKRNGTTTLFAALEIATGKVTDVCYSRHRHQEFLKFLKQVAKAYPGQRLHIVCDNYATHKHPKVAEWLDRNKRITLHFTPTSGSWMNLVEVFFSIITRQAIHRGTFSSVKDLTDAIRKFIEVWNDRCEPFVWTKTADQVLAHCKPPTYLTTVH